MQLKKLYNELRVVAILHFKIKRMLINLSEWLDERYHEVTCVGIIFVIKAIYSPRKIVFWFLPEKIAHCKA